MVACAAFFEESRMKFVDPDRPNRKSGGMGHPEFVFGTIRVKTMGGPHFSCACKMPGDLQP